MITRRTLYRLSHTHPVQLLLEPVDGLVPLPAELGAGLQHALGGRTAREQLHQTLDALVGALLVVVLEALDGVKQALSAVPLVLGTLRGARRESDRAQHVEKASKHLEAMKSLYH